VYGSDVTKHRRYRLALIETAIATNAALAAYTVQHELGGLDPHGLRAVYGIYRKRGGADTLRNAGKMRSPVVLGRGRQDAGRGVGV
jgi:hypothetical protein